MVLTRLRAGSFGIACQNLLPSACTPSQSWNVPSPSTESQAGKRLSRSADAIQLWSILSGQGIISHTKDRHKMCGPPKIF